MYFVIPVKAGIRYFFSSYFTFVKEIIPGFRIKYRMKLFLFRKYNFYYSRESRKSQYLSSSKSHHYHSLNHTPVILEIIPLSSSKSFIEDPDHFFYLFEKKYSLDPYQVWNEICFLTMKLDFYTFVVFQESLLINLHLNKGV
jgi:hypothetical protein